MANSLNIQRATKIVENLSSNRTAATTECLLTQLNQTLRQSKDLDKTCETILIKYDLLQTQLKRLCDLLEDKSITMIGTKRPIEATDLDSTTNLRKTVELTEEDILKDNNSDINLYLQSVKMEKPSVKPKTRMTGIKQAETKPNTLIPPQ